MSNNSLMLVINPVSGRKNSEKNLAKVCRILLENGWSPTVFVTGKRGEAAEYVKDHSKDYERIVAMGGDGTLNEVINGLMQVGGDVPVGFIPCGSTNDFATTQGISADIDTAAIQAACGKETLVDICALNEKYFAFHSAFGYFANVVNTTRQDVKNIFGYLAYIMDGALDLTKLRPVHCKFHVGSEVHEGDYIYGGCLSTISLGGNLLSLDKEMVKLDDGRFEALLIRAPKDLIEFGDLMNDLSTNTLNGSHTEFFDFSEAYCEFDEDPSWCLDGEPYSGPLDTKLTVLQKRLVIIK